MNYLNSRQSIDYLAIDSFTIKSLSNHYIGTMSKSYTQINRLLRNFKAMVLKNRVIEELEMIQLIRLNISPKIVATIKIKI